MTHVGTQVDKRLLHLLGLPLPSAHAWSTRVPSSALKQRSATHWSSSHIRGHRIVRLRVVSSCASDSAAADPGPSHVLGPDRLSPRPSWRLIRPPLVTHLRTSLTSMFTPTIARHDDPAPTGRTRLRRTAHQSSSPQRSLTWAGRLLERHRDL